MRTLAFGVLSTACIALVSACSTTRAPTGTARTAYMRDCPVMEGYPDCDNGYKVDLRLASSAADLEH